MTPAPAPEPEQPQLRPRPAQHRRDHVPRPWTPDLAALGDTAPANTALFCIHVKGNKKSNLKIIFI